MFLSEWCKFPSAPCFAGEEKNLMTARVSMLLKSRASLTCFRDCFLPGRAKDLPPLRQILQKILLRWSHTGTQNEEVKCQEGELYERNSSCTMQTKSSVVSEQPDTYPQTFKESVGGNLKQFISFPFFIVIPCNRNKI